MYLVTAKHVITGYNNLKKQNAALPPLSIRLNPSESGSAGTEFDILSAVAYNGRVWIDNPSGKDVSIIAVNLETLRDKKYQDSFFTSDMHAETIDSMRQGGVSAGDGVYVLGFPMDLARMQRNYVIARHGVIARISETMDKALDSFLGMHSYFQATVVDL